MILHADLDAFYASVAQRDDPALRGKPVLVGSWVVMAASYEARAYGIRGGMGTARARRLCPAALVVDTSWPAYMDARDQVFAVLRRSGAVVEPASIDEAFIDARELLGVAGEPAADLVGNAPTLEPAADIVEGAAALGRAGDLVEHATLAAAVEPTDDLVERAAALAARLRREVRAEVGLPLSIGVARTKVLAKIASRSAKPDGLFVVAPDRELEYLHGLAVEDVWGIGAATAGKLHLAGIRTVGQAAEVGEPALMAIAGKAAGRYVHAIAHNRDRRPVRARRGRRSFGAQRALRPGPRTRAELVEAVGGLAERLAERMGRKQRAGRTVVLRLRFGDYTRASRSRTLTRPTAEAARIAAAGEELLTAALPLIERRGVTLVGLTVTNLVETDGASQLPLFEPP
jgi:DNA polymerase-4